MNAYSDKNCAGERAKLSAIYAAEFEKKILLGEKKKIVRRRSRCEQSRQENSPLVCAQTSLILMIKEYKKDMEKKKKVQMKPRAPSSPKSAFRAKMIG